MTDSVPKLRQFCLWQIEFRKSVRSWRSDLPDTIFVRAYETIMDCVRAVIVGAEGTPYHDGLFFFDVCFPSGYPNVPPENVLFVFWNRLQSARLEDLRPKIVFVLGSIKGYYVEHILAVDTILGF